MSKRTDKKRLKKLNETQTVQAIPTADDYTLCIQYQGKEYDAQMLAARIKEKCDAEGMDSDGLKIYVKPEDQKAYYTCSGGNSFIEI